MSKKSCKREECETPAALVGDDGFCDAHRKGGSEAMSERGRAGALAGKQVLEPGTLPEIATPGDALTATNVVADALASGRLSESRARALKKLVALALDCMDAKAAHEEYEEVRQEVRKISEQMEDRQRRPWE